MPDFIDFVGIDAEHGFEDAVVPVAELKRRHGEQTGVPGGADVARLARVPEEAPRRCVRVCAEVIFQTS